MPWDGSGNVTRTNGTNSGTSVWTDDRDDGVNIRADRHDTHDEDLAGSIENTVALDGQNTTVTDNSILRYATGSDNKFVGVSIGTNELVGRLDGDIVGITIGGSESDAIPTQAEIGAYVPDITDGGTDTYTATFGRTIGTGETAVGDVQSANTTTTPTLNGDVITTKDGSALWAGALEGFHKFQKAASSWLVLEPNPSQQVDPIAYADQAEADAETAANTYTDTQVATRSQIATGTYTGDGTTSQSITGVGFQPRYIKIAPRVTTSGGSEPILETWDVANDDLSGGTWFHLNAGGHSFFSSRIVSLDADGFTVSDASSGSHPNISGVTYNYMAIG